MRGCFFKAQQLEPQGDGPRRACAHIHTSKIYTYANARLRAHARSHATNNTQSYRCCHNQRYYYYYYYYYY